MMVIQSSANHDPEPETLRAAQRRLTRERIVDALVALIDDEHPLEVSMAQVAARAHVSEPTLYRHFPTKRDLFGALAAMQFARVTERLRPDSVDDLAAAVTTVFQRSAGMESVVRWTLAAPDPARVPRPNADSRLATIRRALGDAIAGESAADREHLVRVVLLLTSPMAWLYWKDYLGLEAGGAAETAAWAIRRLV